MKLAVLFSGGKDSMLALMKAGKHHEISCLITMLSGNPESYMFHTPNIHLTEMQADSLGIPLVRQKTKGNKEKELDDLEIAIKKAVADYHIKGVVTGAIKSTYQASRVQRICDKLGLWCFNPLWLMNQEELLNEVLDLKIKAIISGVAGYPLTKEFLGKEIDREMVRKLVSLKRFINPAGEGGELETSVLDCPLFKKRIRVVDATVHYKNFAGIYFVKKAEAEEK